MYVYSTLSVYWKKHTEDKDMIFSSIKTLIESKNGPWALDIHTTSKHGALNAINPE
jgi:hypothetical protein